MGCCQDMVHCAKGEMGTCCFIMSLFLACSSWIMLILAWTTPWFCEGSIEKNPRIVYGPDCMHAWEADSASFYCVDSTNRSCTVLDHEFIPLLFATCVVGGLCTSALIGQGAWYLISTHIKNSKAALRMSRHHHKQRPFYTNQVDPAI